MLTAPLVALGLVAGCLGAGRVLLGKGATADDRRPADAVAGLTGLAIFTAVAGWLVLAGAYSEVAGWALLGAGGLMLAFRSARVSERPLPADRRPEPMHLRLLSAGLGLLALALATGRVLSEFDTPFLSECDDFASYFHFPRLLLESGGFIEPFNLRRLGVLGAAPLVQGFFWRDFGTAAGPMTDALVGQLLVFAAARSIPSALSDQPQPAWLGQAFGLGALLASLTVWNINTVPVLLPMGGALVLMLLTRTVALAGSDHAGRRAAIGWGLVAAWLIGLRTINASFVGVLWIVPALMALRRRDPGQGVRLALAAGATLLGVLPWSLALWRSSGTPLFPLIAGNYRFEGLFSTPLDPGGVLAVVGSSLWASRVWILAGLAVLVPARPGAGLLAIQVVLALAVTVAVTAGSLTAFDSFTILRYGAPFLAAGLVFLAGAALADRDGAGGPKVGLAGRPAWLSGILLLWLLVPVPVQVERQAVWMPNIGPMEVNLRKRGDAAMTVWRSGLKPREYPGRADYVAAQAALPAGARLASAAEKPFFFRFDRQVVHTLDCLGQVSPAPGMPFFQGPEPVAEYLRGLGYTHLAFTPPGAGGCLYSRAHWEDKRANGTRLWQKWAPYFLDFLSNVERLEATYPVLFSSPELVVIDLRVAR